MDDLILLLQNGLQPKEKWRFPNLSRHPKPEDIEISFAFFFFSVNSYSSSFNTANHLLRFPNSFKGQKKNLIVWKKHLTIIFDRSKKQHPFNKIEKRKRREKKFIIKTGKCHFLFVFFKRHDFDISFCRSPLWHTLVIFVIAECVFSWLKQKKFSQNPIFLLHRSKAEIAVIFLYATLKGWLSKWLICLNMFLTTVWADI